MACGLSRGAGLLEEALARLGALPPVPGRGDPSAPHLLGRAEAPGPREGRGEGDEEAILGPGAQELRDVKGHSRLLRQGEASVRELFKRSSERLGAITRS